MMPRQSSPILLLLSFLIMAVMAADANMLRSMQRRRVQKMCRTKRLELSFVVDGSTSITKKKFPFALQFMKDIVDRFSISPTEVRVSLVTYGSRVNRQDAFGFSEHGTKEGLMAAISNVPYRRGNTNTGDAIKYMLEEQMSEARDDARRVAVVLTDGKSQNKRATKQAAQDAHEAGLEVFAIGVGEKVSLNELQNIASHPDFVFEVTEYSKLDQIVEVLSFKACGTCKKDAMDLSLVIDSSVSIRKDNFAIGMQFISDFVKNFGISPNVARVSVITYADRLYMQDAFNFQDYGTKQEVLDKLSSIPWRKGTETKTGDAIRHMRTVQMAQARDDVPHICIVLTDGDSQNKQLTASEALKAREDGILMYAVGVGNISPQELNNIGGDPTRVLKTSSYDKLHLLKDILIKITCEGVTNAEGR